MKKYFSRQFKSLQKGTKKAGRNIVRVPRSVGRLPAQTYQAVNDAVEHAIERTVRRVQNDVEARVQTIASNVKAQVLDEVQQRQTGIMLIAGAIACVALCGITLCFGVVYACVALFNLPIWAGFIIVSALFAIISAVLFVLGRKQLNNFVP